MQERSYPHGYTFLEALEQRRLQYEAKAVADVIGLATTALTFIHANKEISDQDIIEKMRQMEADHQRMIHGRDNPITESEAQKNTLRYERSIQLLRNYMHVAETTPYHATTTIYPSQDAAYMMALVSVSNQLQYYVSTPDTIILLLRNTHTSTFIDAFHKLQNTYFADYRSSYAAEPPQHLTVEEKVEIAEHTGQPEQLHYINLLLDAAQKFVTPYDIRTN